MNPLREMETYISDKLEDITSIPESDKALLSAHVFVVAASSPKGYKQSVDRFLERTPAGTEYAHELQNLHEDISEWIAPREKMPYTRASGGKSKNVALSISIVDTVKKQMVGRYSFFLGLMWDQGMDYPTKEEVKEFAQNWIYNQIDEAIEKQ
jgi:hypothetical protein